MHEALSLVELPYGGGLFQHLYVDTSQDDPILRENIRVLASSALDITSSVGSLLLGWAS